MTDSKKHTFTVGARPKHLTYRHRGQPRTAYVQAVLDTFTSGKAVTFPTDADASRAYVAVVASLRRQHPDRKVRKNQRAVWVEVRPAARPTVTVTRAGTARKGRA